MSDRFLKNLQKRLQKTRPPRKDEEEAQTGAVAAGVAAGVAGRKQLGGENFDREAESQPSGGSPSFLGIWTAARFPGDLDGPRSHSPARAGSFLGGDLGPPDPFI